MPVRKLDRKSCYDATYEMYFNQSVAYYFLNRCG